MPIYRYVCGKPRKKRCTLNDLPEDYFNGDIKYSIDFDDDRLISWTEDGQKDGEKSFVVQLVQHGMFEDKDVQCPVCNIKAIKTIGKVISYFPGNCYLNKVDCQKKIMLDKLENDDPYGHMRPEGDKEDLIKRINRGRKDPSKNFFPGGTGGLKASSPHKPGS